MAGACRPPVFIDRVLEDPGLVRRLVEANAPYLPVQRYFSNAAQYRAASGRGGGSGDMIIAPNFRGDWAYERPLIEGVEPLFGHPAFRDAAREIFGGGLVEPFSVYSNLTWQLPFDQGGGHTDVPEFRGVSRTDYPTWLLSMMGHSRLFEAERIEIATVVSWFYEGSDGGFTYWPDGPDAPPRVHEGRIFNTAIAGDNDRMYHRVRPVGTREKGMLTDLTLDAQLVHRGGESWAVVDAGEERAALQYADLRISISWKAHVYADEAERDACRAGKGGLGLEDVLDRFVADLRARGIACDPGSDPLENEGLVETLARAYVQEPTVFDTAAA